MNTITKLVITITLLVVILFVSFRHNRTIVFDYTENADLGLKEYNQLNQVNSKNSNDGLYIPNTVAETNTNIVNTSNTSKTDSSEKNLQNTVKPSTDETSTFMITSVSTESTESSNDVFVNNESNLPESSQTIYSEIITFEKAVRKYISKGYRISTLNTLNVKNAGLIDDILAQRYDVTFKLAEGGYDIIITLKYQVPEEIKKELLNKKGITITGETILYTFWIKAYR